uniref:Uncharacterized protein n=1 Tax=Rhizophora mucronata TaxID=61149 RepID=A0A2P2ISX6_RHIMU
MHSKIFRLQSSCNRIPKVHLCPLTLEHNLKEMC